jgi:hypothetical protein
MRDLINIIESVGLANRRPGDRWQNSQGNELIFVDLVFHPRVAAFKSPQDLNAAIEAAAQSNGIAPTDIVWSNTPGSNLAFALAHFVDSSNQDYYIGRYFRQISPNATENRFPNDLPGGYRLQKSSAVKERTGYKPTDILTQLDDLSPQDILDQVRQKFGDRSVEVQIMETFMSADRFPIVVPGQGVNFAAFTNYFCELLQPMALVMGKPVQGNAGDAETKFLTRGGYGDCTIGFSAGQTSGLVDSVLTNSSGQSIGISSKAKSGAKASAVNLQNKVAEMTRDAAGQKILDQYPDAVTTIQTIARDGYINAPLNLAVLFDIITAQEKQQILSLRGQSPGQGLDQLTPTLKKIYQSRISADSNRRVPFYHMLAAVAHQVADHVNQRTDFGPAASAILNHGAFVQIYTRAQQQGDNIVLNEFEVQYPSTAITQVLLRADKTYYSTGNKGNFTFQILKNGAQPSGTETDTSAVDTKPDVDLDLIDQAPRLTGPGARAARTQAAPRMTSAVLGRERRR